MSNSIAGPPSGLIVHICLHAVKRLPACRSKSGCAVPHLRSVDREPWALSLRVLPQIVHVERRVASCGDPPVRDEVQESPERLPYPPGISGVGVQRGTEEPSEIRRERLRGQPGREGGQPPLQCIELPE